MLSDKFHKQSKIEERTRHLNLLLLVMTFGLITAVAAVMIRGVTGESLFSAGRFLPLLGIGLVAFVFCSTAAGIIMRRFVNNADLADATREREWLDQLLLAVNKTAAVLLSSDNEDFFETSLRDGIEILADCIDVDRVYIWKNEIKDGVLCCEQQIEWLSAIGLQNHIPKERNFTYTDIPEWYDIFLGDECVNGPVSGMSVTMQTFLKQWDLKSILIIPVHLQDHFWGFVCFDDCRQERVFPDEVINILRSASLMMVSALNRNLQAAIIIDAHERLQLMLDAMPLCCSLWDKDLNIIQCNEEAVKFFHMKNKQEYLEKFFELSPKYQPDGQLSSIKAGLFLKRAFEFGSCVFNWMHQMQDGTPVPSEITLVRVSYGDEYIVAGYTRDLREYERMMKGLEQRDLMLQTVNHVAYILLQSEADDFTKNLLHCMGLMARAVNVDRVYIWKNHTIDGKLYCSQLYEWSEGAEPQQGSELTVNISYDEGFLNWKETLQAGRCINGPIVNLSREEQENLSSQGIVSLLVVPVFLRDEFWGFVGFDDCHRERVFTDNEESILRSGSLLIANSLLRNEMNTNLRLGAARLESALVKAEAASLAKSNFLSNMSHEIRTPMNAIIGMTAIGKSAPDLKKKDYAFEKIEGASSHLLDIINDILEMSKIEAGKFELSLTEFNLEKMLLRVVNIINFRVDEKKQSLSVYLDENIPFSLIGDDQRLAQVITNLLSNAVKFTPEAGSISVRVSRLSEENGICELKFEVKDTGIGISAEQQARLFSSFEQAESSTSRKFGGTGLGLAISKHIVELMDGKIWIESELGKGAAFIFTIKAKLGAEKPAVLLPPEVDWSSIRILVVDDDPELLEYFKIMADQIGVACDTAAGGKEALRLIESKGTYDMYFVDCKMPSMDGIELSNKIKKIGSGNSIIIMISATEWNTIEQEAEDAGVDDFLSKPLFSSSLADCIKKYIVGAESPTPGANEGKNTDTVSGRRVLLVEDVDINREIVMTMMEPFQIEIDCAMNGVEAVEMFAAKPDRYDLIFMDLQMPVLDGFGASRKIRGLNSDKAKTVPIIAMTANVFREDVEKCLEAGMNDHIGKPLDFDKVLEKLKFYLAGNS
jgi:signal transduction histidine kinase/DNA-binding response OmpR family regulator/PAS domain-containing protein